MNVKIQGSGNGTYANTGSCVAVTNYLQHEDLERMKKGEEVRAVLQPVPGLRERKGGHIQDRQQQG